MAKKKAEPVITHTEILCRAIESLESEIRNWELRCEGKPGLEEEIKFITSPLRDKRDALLQLYRIETGVEYSG